MRVSWMRWLLLVLVVNFLHLFAVMCAAEAAQEDDYDLLTFIVNIVSHQHR